MVSVLSASGGTRACPQAGHGIARPSRRLPAFMPCPAATGMPQRFSRNSGVASLGCDGYAAELSV
jgi:hypothetical protein